jgi:hypothetical protein
MSSYIDNSQNVKALSTSAKHLAPKFGDDFWLIQHRDSVVIKYCSGAPGRGKTHALIALAVELANEGKNILIMMPTKELIDKTVKEELSKHGPLPPYVELHGGTIKGERVPVAIADYMRETSRAGNPSGQIVFITHAALPLLELLPCLKDWHLLIDEELQIVCAPSHNIPDSHRVLTKRLRLKRGNKYFGRVLKNEGLKVLAKNEDEEYGHKVVRDEMVAMLSDTLRRVTNENWDAHIGREQLKKLRKGTGKTLQFHMVMLPKLLGKFASVRVVGADLEKGLMMRVWGGLGLVTFVEDKDLVQRLRPSAEYKERPVRVLYAFAEPWSANFKRKVGVDGRTAEQALSKYAHNHLGTQVLWLSNAGRKGSTVHKIMGRNGTPMPCKPHGLNGYSNRHVCAILSSQLPSPEHFKFMAALGVSPDDLRQLIYYSTVHQAATRTSLRDPDSTEPVTILVPDLGAAEYLASKIAGAKVEWVDVDWQPEAAKPMGRPNQYASHAARQAAYRERKKSRFVQAQAILDRMVAQATAVQVDPRESLFAKLMDEPVSTSIKHTSTGRIFTDDEHARIFGKTGSSCTPDDDFRDALLSSLRREQKGRRVFQ